MKEHDHNHDHDEPGQDFPIVGGQPVIPMHGKHWQAKQVSPEVTKKRLIKRKALRRRTKLARKVTRANS